MRRLAETSLYGCGTKENERGVIAPVAAILMVALLGFGALAVDVGAMYSEKTQLQNGADSAALAVAQACAKVAASSPCAANQKAQATPFANGNALDGASNVVSATVNAGTVDVTTETPAGAGGEHFSLFLARALGINSVEIQASAQATFGGVSGYDSLPMAFSKCEADSTLLTDGTYRYFPSHGSADRNKKEPYACPGNSSGQEMPGGFGWLVDGPVADCSVHVDIYNPWVDSRPGNSYETACADTMSAWWNTKNKTPPGEVKILVPIFDDNDPKRGAHGQYHIQAFAELSIDSWHLSGTSTNNHEPETYLTSNARALSATLKLANSDLGLFGRFVRTVSLEEAAQLGGPTIYGSSVVKLTR